MTNKRLFLIQLLNNFIKHFIKILVQFSVVVFKYDGLTLDDCVLYSIAQKKRQRV
jgi:hypothetical protein